MKILLVSPYFLPHKGGVEQFNLELGKRLAKTNDLTILSSKFNTEKEKESLSGLKIVRIPHLNLLGKTLPVPKKISHIKKNFTTFKPDIVITSTRFFPINFWATFYAKKMKIKHIHIEHGSSFVTLNNSLLSLIGRIYDLTIGRYVIKSAKIVFGISEKSVKLAESLGAKKTDLFYNSIDCKFFDGKKTEHAGQLVLTYVGRLIYAKGVHDLIEVFKNIKNKNLTLNIVGSGNYEQSLREVAGLDKRIKFLGQMGQAEIKELLSQTDIFVNPSYNEGLPTSVLEAGAMKCAVIATLVGGTGEIIDGEENGLLIEPNNNSSLKSKLVEILNNDERRKKLALELEKKVRNQFCWEKNIGEFKHKLKHIHIS